MQIQYVNQLLTFFALKQSICFTFILSSARPVRDHNTYQIISKLSLDLEMVDRSSLQFNSYIPFQAMPLTHIIPKRVLKRNANCDMKIGCKNTFKVSMTVTANIIRDTLVMSTPNREFRSSIR